ncbi:MAG: 3-octaprenyl-4hydroxybenzoate decarboxylase, partial [Chloroflexi bacterium]|nr:3-octaprenyl-4hydroxybenzoate decarboxylase [Chloroflexota bacterium]
MTYSGLREFIDLLEEQGELARVSVPVDLNQELGAICVKSLRAAGPALFFEHPGSSDIPLLTNLLATRRRYAMALECEQGETQREWNRRADTPIPPVSVEQGACQEVVFTGADVDLTRLPAPIWNSLDGGPYLTLSCHHTTHPETGVRNVGIYRNQVHDAQTLGILA